MTARPQTIETLEHDLCVLTRRLERILKWERVGLCSDVYLAVFGGRIMREIAQTYDRLKELRKDATES